MEAQIPLEAYSIQHDQQRTKLGAAQRLTELRVICAYRRSVTSRSPSMWSLADSSEIITRRRNNDKKIITKGLNPEHGDSMVRYLTHWGRVKQICVFNTRLFSLHNTLNYAIHRACLRMVLLKDIYRNLTSLWINLQAPRFLYMGTGVSLLSRERFLYI